MNAGARLDEVLHTVRAPAHLVDLPYLRPVYDEPEFVVRNVWRLYGGWWDGNPATFKPAPERDLAGELAALAGGAAALADRALALLEERRTGTTRDRTPRACVWPGTWRSWPGWRPLTTPPRSGHGGPSSPAVRSGPPRPWRKGCSAGRRPPGRGPLRRDD